MPPKLLSEDGRHVVIRPLAYVPEREIERYARARDFPIIPCKLCGSQENLQRVAVKKMLADWEREFPGRTETIFSALRNVAASHLADPRRFDFAALDALRQRQAPATPRATSSPGTSARRRIAARSASGRSNSGRRAQDAAREPQDGFTASRPTLEPAPGLICVSFASSRDLLCQYP